MDDKNFKGHLAMFTAYILFGLNMPVSKAIMSAGQVNSYSLTFYRMAGAAVLFWLASLFSRREKVAIRDIILLFFASLFGIQINQVCFIMGLSMTSPIDASVITTLVPIITMLMAALVLREPITWKKTTGVLIGGAGAVILVLTANRTGGGNSSMAGNLLCVTSTFSFAVYLTAFRNLIGRYNSITLMKWMFLFAALCCTPLCWKDVSAIDYGSVPLQTYLGVAYVIVAATFISYLLLPIGQKHLRPTVVSMYNYLQPLVASLVAVATGMDSFGWTKAASAILVFAGVYFVTQSKSRAQIEAESTRKG